jgi:hypothetical protein
VGGVRSNVPVAIVDPAASYRTGLGAALSRAGFAPAEPSDPQEWATAIGQKILLWTVRSPGEWKGFRRLRG